MSNKRTLDAFFQPSHQKKAKIETVLQELSSTTLSPPSNHKTYPFPVSQFSDAIQAILKSEVPAKKAREIKHLPDLDLLYFEPFIPRSIENEIFTLLRNNLFFYRVKYKIKRGSFETDINTPRFTTVFGIDETSKFGPDGDIIDATSEIKVPGDRYKKCVCPPRPIPGCLDQLRQLTEVFTGHSYNFCLVNYYANGNDSISYHSDDERFLGPEPAIASFSFGTKRDFLLKHKPTGDKELSLDDEAMKPLKYPLNSGDMILMRGGTQANWLHSIPKRRGGDADKGRINITFRKAMIPAGAANYYQYNVGVGEVYKWDVRQKEMKPWIG